MQRSLNVRLEPETLERLRRLAAAELRDTRAQAAILIRDGLRRAEAERARRGATSGTPEASR